MRTSKRPSMTAPVCVEVDANAMTVPLKEEFVPSVTEVPTCQKMRQAWAPLITLTVLAEAVIRVEATWKMKTAFGSPWPSNVRGPPSASGPVDLYTPASSVLPTRSPATLAVGARPAASS